MDAMDTHIYPCILKPQAPPFPMATGRRPPRVPTLEDCVEICDGRDTCKGFAHQLGGGTVSVGLGPRFSGAALKEHHEYYKARTLGCNSGL